MAEFLAAAAVFVLASVALGLIRLLRGPSAADRMMAAQLLGTGGAAICLLLAARGGALGGIDAIADVALTLALLAALAAAALSLVPRRAGPEGEP